MLSAFIFSFCFGLCCAVLSMAYTCIMVEPDGMLDWWKDYLHKKLIRRNLFHPRNPPSTLQVKLFKVLVDCTACFAGQLCLWLYLAFDYNWKEHLFSVGFAIVFGKVLNTLYIKLKHTEVNG